MFKACFKKDFFEQIRTGKFFIFLALGVGICVLSILSTFLISTIMQNVDFSGLGEFAGEFEGLISNDYAASLNYFMSYMISYFTIVVICMIMNTIGKEIKQKKWIAPMCSGVKPESMILSKILVTTLAVIVSVIAACLIHFVFTIIIFEPSKTLSIGKMFACYGCYILFMIFTVVVTMSINAITKKAWVSPTIMIIMLILGTSLMQTIKVAGEKTLIMYTPYAFYDLSYTLSSYAVMGALEWVISSLTFVAVTSLILLWAVKSNKIKASKN